MRFSALLTVLILTGSSAIAAPVGSKYVLLDAPYNAAALPAQTYTTPAGTKTDPWSFSHGLLTPISSTPESSEFRDAGGRTLRVNTPDGQLRGLYPVVWDKALSRAWSGKAWAYGGLNYACRLNEADSVSFQLLPEQPLQVARVYRQQGTLPGVSHRNTYSAGILYSDEPVRAADPLLVEFSAPGWKETSGGGSLSLDTRKLAPSACSTGFLPLLDQGGLGPEPEPQAAARRPVRQTLDADSGHGRRFLQGLDPQRGSNRLRQPGRSGHAGAAQYTRPLDLPGTDGRVLPLHFPEGPGGQGRGAAHALTVAALDSCHAR